MHMETSAATGAGARNVDRYVDDVEASNVLGLSRTYMRQLRLTGDGPRFAKFGRAVRYRVADLFTWAESRSATSTSQVEAA